VARGLQGTKGYSIARQNLLFTDLGRGLEDPAVDDDRVVDKVETLELGGEAVQAVGVSDVREVLERDSDSPAAAHASACSSDPRCHHSRPELCHHRSDREGWPGQACRRPDSASSSITPGVDQRPAVACHQDGLFPGY
jgi:hypothetical protein